MLLEARVLGFAAGLIRAVAADGAVLAALDARGFVQDTAPALLDDRLLAVRDVVVVARRGVVRDELGALLRGRLRGEEEEDDDRMPRAHRVFGVF